jgi:predicted transcriptional regulator
MTATTIKVDNALRDRLAALARERGITMGAILAEATEHLERETFFATARRQLDDLHRDDPDGWAAERAEAESWQAGTDRDTLSHHDDDGWWE